MKRLVVGLVGAVIGVIGLALLGSGAAVLALFGTDGTAQIPIGTVKAPDGRAVVVTDFEISSDTPLPVDQTWFDLELEVSSRQPLFVGVAGKSESLAYLQGVSYELITSVDSSAGTLDSTTIPGDRIPASPSAQTFWTDQQAGREVVVRWPVSAGDSTLVVMNEDADRDVDADVAVRATVAWAGTAAIGMVVAGLVVIGIAIWVLVVAFRAGDDRAPVQYPPGA